MIHLKREINSKTTVYLAPFLFFFLFIKPLAAQDIPHDFWPTRNLAILHDFGYLWPENSVFKPYRWDRIRQSFSKKEWSPKSFGWLLEDLQEENAQPGLPTPNLDSLQAKWWNGILLQKPLGKGGTFANFSSSVYSNLMLWFRNRLSLQLYLRATSEPSSLSHFTGQPREIRRFGLNSAEFDHGSLSYQNNWLLVQFGRGRQNWGPFESNNLALSNNSPAYDHLTLEGKYKRFKGRFFYGFLESVENGGNINRYLVGHGIEYSNHRNLVVGLTENIIFSGLNRPFDFSYLNPFLPHIEVELNNRTNDLSKDNAGANAVWSIAIDWLPLSGLRLTGHLVLDEIQFDQEDRNRGRGDVTATRFRAAYSKAFGKVALTGFVDYTKVGTFTLRHGVGMNNFVSRELPLGTNIGSDSDLLLLGSRFLFPARIVLTTSVGYKREGENSLLKNLYEPNESLNQKKFPSGIVQHTRFLDWRLTYSPLRNIELTASGRFSNSSGGLEADQKYVIFSLNGYLPWRFGL